MSRKTFTPFLSTAAFLIFFTAGTLFFAVRYLDPNDYKADIAFFLLDATGRPVTLEGDIHLEFFPWFGVRTGPVRIGNAKGFRPDEFLEISSVYLRVKVLPFFQKKLVVDRIFLNDPVLDLRRGRDGVSNWDDLIRRLPSLEMAPTPISHQVQPYFKGVEVLGLTMNNATVRLFDEATGTDCVASNLMLRTGPIVPGKPLGLDIGTDLNSTRAGFFGNVHLSGLLDGLWAGDAWLEHTSILVRSTLPGSGGVEAEFAGILDYEAADGGFLLTNCELRTMGQVFHGQFSGRRLLSNPTLNGTLEGGPVDPRAVWRAFSRRDVFPEDQGTFRSVAVKTGIRFDNASLSLDGLHVDMDGGSVNGHIRFADWKAPRIDFDLAVEDVSAGRYLRAFLDDMEPPGDGGGVCAGQVAEWPVEVNGRLEFGPQRIEGVDADKLVARITARQGRLEMEARADAIFGGKLKASLVSERSGGTIGRSTLSLTARGMDAGSVLERFGANRTVSGRADADVHFSAQGCGIESLVSAGSGSAHVRLYGNGEKPGTVRWGNRTLSFSLSDFHLELSPEHVGTASKSGGGGRVAVALDVDGPVRAGRPDFAFKSTIRGGMDFAGENGTLRIRDAKLAASLKNGFLPAEHRTAVLTARAGYNARRDVLFLERAELNALGMKAGLDGEATGVFSREPHAAGTLSIPQIKADSIFRLLDVPRPVTRDRSVLKTASFSTEFSATPDRVRLSGLRLAMDGTELLGTVTLEGRDDPLVRFDLDAGNVDVDRYRPPYVESPYDCNNPDPRPGTPLPLKLVRALRLDGTLNMKRFKIIGLEFGAMETRIRAEHGDIRLTTRAGEYFGGTFAGDADFKVMPDLLDGSFRLKGTGFDAGLFLMGLDDAPYVKGTADLEFDLTMAGADTKALTSSLAGTSAFTVLDGSWNFMLGQTGKMELTEKEAALPQNQRTHFDIGNATLTVKNGVFTNKDLQISGVLLDGSGYGNFSLPADTIDLTFIITVGRTATVPVKVTGCLSDPEDHVAKGELVGGIAKDIMTLPLRPFQFLQELLFQ